jgi:general secretion pathway protein K
MPADFRQSTGARRNQRGSIAILALWGVALIFMLLAPVAFLTRSELQVAHNAIGASRARLAAEAGTQLGLARLLRRHDGTVYFDGTAENWLQGSTHVAIAIIDEAGKIDLNVAPQDFLAGLFAAVGRSREEARLLACNVLDRRGDSGAGCPEPGGAQPARRFAVPEELAQVPGIDDDLYDRVADSITVATAASAIDPLVAPRPVLKAIPGATDNLVDAFVENRATWRDLSGAGGAALLSPAAAAFLMATPGRDFTIAATATTSDGARYRAELQVRLTERPTAPYQVMAWRAPPVDRGRQTAPPAPARAP